MYRIFLISKIFGLLLFYDFEALKILVSGVAQGSQGGALDELAGF